MAMTTQQQTEAYQFFIIAFGAAPGVEYMTQISDAYNAGMTTQEIVNVYTTKAQFTSTYPTFFSSEQFANALINNVVGSSASAEAKAEAKADIIGALNAGWTRGDVVYQIFTNLAAKDPAEPMWGATSTLLANKVAVAKYVTEVQLNGSTDVGVLQGVLAGVTAASDVSTPAKIEAIIGGSASGGANNLTVGMDSIFGTTEGQIYKAPIVQNQNGAVTNTLESGDVIAAVGTGNTLKADLALTISGTQTQGPAISAATNNIQVVELRAQTGNTDNVGAPHANNSHVDAENFNGVQQWWTTDSRASIQVEDVRTRPEDTTIGMRNTDPEVGFRVYFDSEQLTENARAENSALTLKLDDILKPGDLTDVPVDGVSFKLDGVLYVLKSTEIGEAKTHTELVTALEAAIAAQPALAGVTVTLNANTTITLQDPAGKVFEKGAWAFIDGVVPADGNIVFQQDVGNPVLVDQPITTNVVLDNVGRTSAGGALDIGSLGDGGVQQFDVTVDRGSWVSSMGSTSHLGNDIAPGVVQFNHLEIVNFASTGANGNVTVGERTANLDGRVSGGLTDVRVVNGADFKGQMNVGVNVTVDSIDRYLDGATDSVDFVYEGSKQNDIFNIDVDANVSNDPDFRMEVNMDAGNDRLILSGADNLDNISVDGGTGTNTFVTSTSIGVGVNPADVAKHEFASFANFQNLEIEGGGSAVDFTTLNGVTSVVVATNAGADTDLIDLAANNGIVLSGKNQTLGNNSNADQSFGTIRVQGAEGAELTVTLQNTARIDGNLYVDELYVEDENLGNQSAVRTLNIVSAGARQTTNEVDNIHAERVGNFNFSGTQDLSVNIRDAANASGPAAGVIALKVDGSALTGDLTVQVNDDVINAVDTNKTASFKGTAGTKDTLVFDSGVNTTAKTSVSGFETISFLGTGQFNAVNTTGVTLYESAGDALKVTNMQGVENVELGTYDAFTDTGSNPGDAQDFRTNAVSNDSALNLKSSYAAVGTQDINTKGFTTLNLNLDTLLAQANGKDFDLNLEKVAVNGADAAVVVTNGVYANAAAVPVDDFTKSNLTNVVVTGGSSTATNVQDSLNLNTLAPTVKLLDVSGYKGVVTGTIGDALTTTIGAIDVKTGNTVVKVGAFGIDITDASHAVGAETITTFQFTTDAAKAAAGDADFTWQINDFVGIDEAGADLGNLTVLDLSGLGVTGLVDIQVADVGGEVVITSNGTANFQIELTGVVAADLGLENFKFA